MYHAPGIHPGDAAAAGADRAGVHLADSQKVIPYFGVGSGADNAVSDSAHVEACSAHVTRNHIIIFEFLPTEEPAGHRTARRS